MNHYFNIVNAMCYLIFLQLIYIVENQIITLDNLGLNLVANPSFQLPVLGTGQWYTQYSLMIDSWNCTSICQIMSIPQTHSRYPITALMPNNQVIDLASSNFLQNVTQNILLPEQGYYLLRFQWIQPLVRPLTLNRSFSIYFSDILVQNVQVNSSNYPTNYAVNYSNIVKLSAGIVQLKFRMLGGVDSSGVMIDDIELRKITVDDQLSTVINYMMFNNATSIINSIPGARVLLSGLMSYFNNFDRLQFYYYHHQNNSYYATTFLSAIASLQKQKGILVQNILKQNLTDSSSKILNLANQLRNTLDFKQIYTESSFMIKNQNGDGFMSNNLEFFIYEIPFIVGLQLFLMLIFRLCFNNPISKLVRKYCMMGLIIVLCFQGNSEQISFYFFTQCRKLFSTCIGHKLVNVFLVLFYYGLQFFSFGLLFWFKYHYRRKVKYFIEGYRIKNYSLICSSFESGMVPILLGCIHAMMLDCYLYQNILLGTIQTSFIALRVTFMKNNVYRYQTRAWINIMGSGLRILFIITFYIYQKIGVMQTMNEVHYYLIVTYIVNWVIEVLFQIYVYIIQAIVMIQIVIKSRKSSKIISIFVPNIPNIKLKVNNAKILHKIMHVSPSNGASPIAKQYRKIKHINIQQIPNIF